MKKHYANGIWADWHHDSHKRVVQNVMQLLFFAACRVCYVRPFKHVIYLRHVTAGTGASEAGLLRGLWLTVFDERLEDMSESSAAQTDNWQAGIYSIRRFFISHFINLDNI